jgi:hypothetical protein
LLVLSPFSSLVPSRFGKDLVVAIGCFCDDSGLVLFKTGAVEEPVGLLKVYAGEESFFTEEDEKVEDDDETVVEGDTSAGISFGC